MSSLIRSAKARITKAETEKALLIGRKSISKLRNTLSVGETYEARKLQTKANEKESRVSFHGLSDYDENYEDRAKRLYVSPNTLKNHMIRMMDKLYAENRTHIVPLCIKKGIIEVVRE